MRGDESGQVLPLVLGLSLLMMAIAGLAVDGTKAFLHRRTLQNAADSAALAAAGEIDTAAYRATAGSSVVPAERAARHQAERALAARGIGGRAQVAVSEESVSVVLRDEVPTLFLRLVGISELAIAAEARAAPMAGGVP